MPVMAASVHHSLIARSEGQTGFLVNRQRVDIGPQRNDAFGAVASRQGCDDSGRSQLPIVNDPSLLQKTADFIGRSPLLP